MKHHAITLVAVSLLSLGGCGNQATDGPPAIRLGYDVCAECNMIISDARWATATIVPGPRGPEPRLFDDFNCQVNFENEHAGEIIARWSHDYATGAWLKTETAQFIFSRDLRTPMGSNAAAFGARSDADAVLATLAAQRPPTPSGAPSGDVVPFAAAWKRLGSAAP
ncbi:MAG: hypothetical protein AMXMBFR77_00530 [Phycisphaerales bacterium]|nr:nitrous oxide reductase accessory protein NosL [Phycisphaerales bacterium]GIK18477.1 MAG: hypothetical protein BroJett004_06410 [Planctomycetota bacterium]